jgi:hypothetical protein
MRQEEKLEVILKYLYERKHDGKHYNVYTILAENGIETNRDEVFALGKQLLEEDIATRLNQTLSVELYIKDKQSLYLRLENTYLTTRQETLQTA